LKEQSKEPEGIFYEGSQECFGSELRGDLIDDFFLEQNSEIIGGSAQDGESDAQYVSQLHF